MKFKWSGRAGGALVSGVIEAPDEIGAKYKLQRSGIEVISVKPLKARRTATKKKGANISLSFRKRLSDKELAAFSEQLSALLEAGVGITESLESLEEEYKNTRIFVALRKIYVGITQDGLSFAEAVERTGMFPSLYVSLVKTAEQSGTLDQTLQQLADMHAQRANIKSKVKKAMIYPSFVILMSIGALAVFLAFVMPKIKSLYGKFNQDLPAITKAVLAMSDAVVHHWFAILIAIVALFIVFKILLMIKPVRRAWDSFKLRVPLLGRVVLLSDTINAFNALSVLLNNGVGIIQSLELSIPIVNNVVIKEELQKAKQMIETEGVPFHEAVRNTKLPKKLATMISVGERTGQLSEMINKYLVMAEKDLNTVIDTLIATIEPLSTIIVGAIVLILLLAMYLPIFGMSNIVKQ